MKSTATGAGEWPFFLVHDEAILSLCQPVALVELLLLLLPISMSKPSPDPHTGFITSSDSCIVGVMHLVFGKMPNLRQQEMVLDKLSQMVANNRCAPLLLVQPIGGGKSAVRNTFAILLNETYLFNLITVALKQY
jgi:hypothetical protein